MKMMFFGFFVIGDLGVKTVVVVVVSPLVVVVFVGLQATNKKMKQAKNDMRMSDDCCILDFMNEI
jgi:hypothetical protein